MLGATRSVALVGMEGYPIEVEVSVAPGLPTFSIVGLPDPSIQEARERVRAAIVAAGEDWPQQRITVNLSPAHLRKTGSAFDLAIAIGVLVARGRIDGERARRFVFLGELSLDGTVRRVRGVLPSAIAATEAGFKRFVVAPANAQEAAAVDGLDVLPCDSLGRAVRFLRGECDIDPWSGDVANAQAVNDGVDFSDVRGNGAAKHAAEIAAAGGHNLLLLGSPGGGKTMLARRIPGILPPMTESETIEVTKIHSVAGLLAEGASLVTTRPFRAPHHSGSVTGLVGGGGAVPIPGEVSLAHRGVLFLDEYGEFRREALQALRQPIEDGFVTIVRARWAVRFPARFQLVAASNPCPCGHFGDKVRACVCVPGRIAGYQERLQGPIIDRIDMQVVVERLQRRELFAAPDGDPTEVIRARVAAARERQQERCARLGITCNAELPPRDLAETARLTSAARRTIEQSIETVGLTARSAHRLARVARTVADLAGDDVVTDLHVSEVLQYRVLDGRAG